MILIWLNSIGQSYPVCKGTEVTIPKNDLILLLNRSQDASYFEGLYIASLNYSMQLEQGMRLKDSLIVKGEQVQNDLTLKLKDCNEYNVKTISELQKKAKRVKKWTEIKNYVIIGLGAVLVADIVIP